MVFYFSSVTPAGAFTLYMGRDKFENEELIKFAWPEDVWYAATPTQQHSTGRAEQ